MSLSPAEVSQLFARANAARWGLSPARFGEALRTAVEKGGDPSQLHLEDLALAAACADGHGAAWDHFVLTYRPVLYRSADAIDPTGGARESADALYADLFGLKEKDGARQSLLRYFHGRSRLDTWLRAVLSQRHVDRIRAARRTEALPDEDGAHPLQAAATPLDPDSARLTHALHAALSTTVAALEPRDRLRMRLYYAQQMRLAAIGRMLGEHEASVSRHLTRVRAEVRAAVAADLRARHGFDDALVEACFSKAAEDPGAFDLGRLFGTGAGDPETGKNPPGPRSNKGERPRG